MKRTMVACCLLFLIPGLARAQGDAALTREVNAFVDEWHDDAAHARLTYFDKIASDGIYIGTDKTELWRRDEFRTWARKQFERESAWSFKATRRNVYFSPDKSFIWFDELLDTPNMGTCMASGVIRRTGNGFEIVHYQLSIAVPNEVAGRVTALIREFEARPARK